jgi:hypothetical protein
MISAATALVWREGDNLFRGSEIRLYESAREELLVESNSGGQRGGCPLYEVTWTEQRRLSLSNRKTSRDGRECIHRTRDIPAAEVRSVRRRWYTRMEAGRQDQVP